MGVPMTVSESNDDNNAVHSEQVNRKKVQTRLRRDIARVLIRVSQHAGGMLTGYIIFSCKEKFKQTRRLEKSANKRRDIARVLIRVSQQTGGMLTGYMQEKLQTQKDLIENLF